MLPQMPRPSHRLSRENTFLCGQLLGKDPLEMSSGRMGKSCSNLLESLSGGGGGLIQGLEKGGGAHSKSGGYTKLCLSDEKNLKKLHHSRRIYTT